MQTYRAGKEAKIARRYEAEEENIVAIGLVSRGREEISSNRKRRGKRNREKSHAQFVARTERFEEQVSGIQRRGK